MRKVIALEFVTLDGVIQAGGGPEEDTSGGFAYGGWQAPYSDDVIGTVMNRQMNMPFDLLLGRKTFEIWAPYWPQHADICQVFNDGTQCGPPNGLYCSGCGPDASCTPNCAFSLNWWTSTACWCTKCSSGHYFKCCDCECFDEVSHWFCGCRVQMAC
jgi:hypothetical protein